MLSLFCLLGMLASSPNPVMDVTLTIEQPSLHFYQVELVVPASDQEKRQLRMAAWTPGSYKVRDFARNVEGFSAQDMANTALAWRKLDKSTWEIDTPDKAAFKISYRVFAYEFSVRTSYLDDQMGFINPASVFFYEDGQLDRPYAVQTKLPEGWSVVSSLPSVGAQAYRAENFDQLVDSPLQFGPLRRHDFQVQNIPHTWVISGDLNANEQEMVTSLQKIGETVGSVFGGYPFQDYTIFSQFRLIRSGGGLEHHNSTMVQGNASRLRTKKGWDDFLGLILHEYFHAWNVKAIHDEVLGPFDYQKENYSNLLWLHEGWTSYYDQLLMGRAGFWDDKRLLKEFATNVKNYQETPGVALQSLTEGSFNAWIQYYQPSETSHNSQVSYYEEGAISGFALDLLIRHETGGTKSLDNVMRSFYDNYARQGQPITWEIVHQIVTEVAGPAGATFLDTYVNSATPIPMETYLGYAGLELKWEPDVQGPPEDAKGPHAPNPEVSLGATLAKTNGSVFVRDIARGRAGWKAGLDFGDELLAINQRRVSAENLDEILDWSHPGDEVSLLVNRGGRVLDLKLTLEALPQKLKLKLRKEPTALEKQIYVAMFGEPKKDPSDSESDDSESEGSSK